MIIQDSFEHQGKRAVYIAFNNEEIPESILEVIIEGKKYDVIMCDRLHSIAGAQAVVILLDTTDDISAGCIAKFI